MAKKEKISLRRSGQTDVTTVSLDFIVSETFVTIFDSNPVFHDRQWVPGQTRRVGPRRETGGPRPDRRKYVGVLLSRRTVVKHTDLTY